MWNHEEMETGEGNKVDTPASNPFNYKYLINHSVWNDLSQYHDMSYFKFPALFLNYCLSPYFIIILTNCNQKGDALHTVLSDILLKDVKKNKSVLTVAQTASFNGMFSFFFVLPFAFVSMEWKDWPRYPKNVVKLCLYHDPLWFIIVWGEGEESYMAACWKVFCFDLIFSTFSDAKDDNNLYYVIGLLAIVGLTKQFGEPYV